MKKLTSLILALALVLSLGVTAFAANIGDETNATGDIGGEGEIAYVDMEIYEFLLPTSANLDFQIDPQGFFGVTDGATLADMDAAKGKILGGDPVLFINNSSVNTTLKVTFTGVVTGATAGAGDGTDEDAPIFVTDIDNVEEDDSTAKNVLLYVAPSTADIQKATDTFVSTEQAFVISETPLEMVFALPAAEYTLDMSAKKINLKDNTGHGTGLQIGGNVNSLADWTPMSDATLYADALAKVSFTAAYEFAKDDTVRDEDTVYDDGEGLFLLPVAAQALAGRPEAEFGGGAAGAKLLSGATGETELTKMSAVSASVSFRIDGLDDKLASDLTALSVGGTALTNPTHYTVKVTGGKLHVTFTAAAGWFSSVPSTYTIVATVSGKPYTFNLTK